jgi:hypothetical protein
MLVSGTHTIQLLDIHAVNVKHLSFKVVTLPNGIDTFISQSFSQLSRLKFEHCTFESKKLTLLNTKLNYFELEDKFPEENGDVEVITKNNNEKRRYKPIRSLQIYRHIDILDMLNSSMNGYVESLPGDGIRSLPYFSLVCNSLQDIFLLNAS